MGAMYAADLFGMALFSLMQVRLGQVDGATTQIVVMLTSIAYLPGVGLALAGTTLVGQAIGAGDRDWARRLGNRVIVRHDGLHGRGRRAARGAGGPWVMPLFVSSGDPQARRGREARRSCCCGSPRATSCSTGCSSARASRCAARATCACRRSSSSGCRGACSCRSRTCCRSRRARAGSTVLPQFGYGAVGGWFALLAYVVLLAVAHAPALALGTLAADPDLAAAASAPLRQAFDFVELRPARPRAQAVGVAPSARATR